MKWLQLILNAFLRYQQGRTLIPRNIEPLLGLLASILVILIAVANSIAIGYALIVVWSIMAYVFYRKGYTLKELLNLSWTGAKTSIIVMQIFLLIGWLIAMWQAAGVIPMIIATGIDLIDPSIFIVCAFLITAIVSMLLGTALGAVGTIGIVLITMARAGSIPENIVVGAIIAGAYFGDRNGPLSSSASLVAALTHTKVSTNIPIMFKDGIPALIISTVLYLLLSQWYPLNYENSLLSDTIHFIFNIDWTLWIPVIIVIGLLPLKVSIRWPIGLSALAAAILAYTNQDASLSELGWYTLTGFELPHYNPLANIIHGGGLQTMFIPTLSIFMATAISGMLEGVGFWNDIRQLLERAKTRSDVFAANVGLAFLTGAVGCSQAIAVVMTHSIMRITYAQRGIQDEDVMLDFENSGILIAPLQPWNIAAYVPIVMMGTSSTGYVPFAFFLYLVPLIYWLRLRKQDQPIIR